MEGEGFSKPEPFARGASPVESLIDLGGFDA
jgi:hypothetical protein